MYATNELVHLTKIPKVGIESENEKCLKFLFRGRIRKPYARPVRVSITKASKMSNHEHK